MVCLLVITNPSVKDFKDYIGRSSYDGLHRTSNYFLLSTYRFGQDKYLGLFGNLYKLDEKRALITPTTLTAEDSMKMDSSFHKPIAKYDENGVLIRRK